MAKIKDYWQLADSVHIVRDKQVSNQTPLVGTWDCTKWEWGTWYGDGFQGGVFQNDEEIVCAFAGTKGGLGQAPVSDFTADLRILVKILPNQAGNALGLVRAAAAIAHGRPISMVGHSLGGALAQVAGNWSTYPFISFNGPGMRGSLRASAWNIFKPVQWGRSILSPSAGATVGISFRIRGDLVAGYGTQLGKDIVMNANGVPRLQRHGLNVIEAALRRGGYWKQTPSEIEPKWGEG